MVWDDGRFTIEDTSVRPLWLTFTNSEARALRKFLNRPPVKDALGIPSARPQAIREVSQDEPSPVQLGQHIAEVAEQGKTIAVGNTNQGMVHLDAAESYRLFVTLYNLYNGKAS